MKEEERKKPEIIMWQAASCVCEREKHVWLKKKKMACVCSNVAGCGLWTLGSISMTEIRRQEKRKPFCHTPVSLLCLYYVLANNPHQRKRNMAAGMAENMRETGCGCVYVLATMTGSVVEEA